MVNSTSFQRGREKTGGRQKGVANKVTIETRERIEKESDPIGFLINAVNGEPVEVAIWQYMSPEGRVHPSYGVSFTDTGRTNSRDPNGQNFPKRGSRWAKLYQQIFIPTPGYKFVAADLSQVELRVAAEMAQEQTMLRIFREGGDIHVMTAAFVLGLPYEQVAAWKGSETLLFDVANDVPGCGDFLRKLNPGARAEATVGDYFKQKRFEAKAVKGTGYLWSISRDDPRVWLF